MNAKPEIQPITRRMLLEQRIARIETHLKGRSGLSVGAGNRVVSSERDSQLLTKLAALRQELAELDRS